MKTKAWRAALLLGLTTAVVGQNVEKSVLSLPLFPAPILRQDIPLSRALGDIGSYVRDGYVLFGLELRSQDGREPLVSIDLEPGSNLGDALVQLLNQIPGYEYEVVSPHMINIYPAGSKRDSADVLNTPVHQFDAVNVDPNQILSRPKDFISELAARLRPKTGPNTEPGGVAGDSMGGINPPTVTLHMKNTTVRQILNATSEAMAQFPPDHPPVGWLYIFQPDPNSPTGGRHSWNFLFSAPRNWKGARNRDQES